HRCGKGRVSGRRGCALSRRDHVGRFLHGDLGHSIHGQRFHVGPVHGDPLPYAV
ncbi:hypothetical protein, partial [Hungatella effluvii]|uniref:hypothetical protein n=1 Tax=Hungatella effluvii TaxID=1096246 RepID=UPI003D80F29C